MMHRVGVLPQSAAFGCDQSSASLRVPPAIRHIASTPDRSVTLLATHPIRLHGRESGIGVRGSGQLAMHNNNQLNLARPQPVSYGAPHRPGPQPEAATTDQTITSRCWWRKKSNRPAMARDRQSRHYWDHASAASSMAATADAPATAHRQTEQWIPRLDQSFITARYRVPGRRWRGLGESTAPR